jgi:ABC-type Na+ transport system ATPase subunit NatA
MSSHLTEDVAPVCSHAVVLRSGRVVFDGSLRDLGGLPEEAAEPSVERVNEAYLALVRD